MATATKALTVTVTTTVTSATSTSTARAPAQGGILDGLNPVVYNPASPIILFIIQAGIIIVFCRLLHFPLSWLRQPRVIAEVIGGILLGPSVLGRIPGFTDAIFPTVAMPNLTLVANLGLILFLFIVGLEVDLRWFAKNWRPAVSVSLAGMALPFGLGCAISWGIYNAFKDEPGIVYIAFPTFMLFVGVATAITAFPVLCRILTELQLLNTPVGIIVLSAGVGNDVVGWILLALCVALVNAGSGMTALWVLLTCIGYALFLAFAVRPAFLSMLRSTRSIENGPSQAVIAITLLMMLASAFFTGVIGVHPIFGAFMAGLICPHEGGFAIAVTEKVEDLVSALFLPLYFALSGLSTNLGLLNNGITWSYVIGIIAVAFLAKFVGCSIPARMNGLLWRESFAIGSLMSCKGLVELIVLNIGLQAKILTQRTFTMFVVMALVTTFATTPLTSVIYPPSYQRKVEAWRRGEINWDGTAVTGTNDSLGDLAMHKLEFFRVKRLLVYLRLDNMPTLLAFVSLLGGERNHATSIKHPRATKAPRSSALETLMHEKAPVEVHGVRLAELTERDSAVMKVSEVDEYSFFDPVLNAFRVLGQLHNLMVSGEVAMVPETAYAETLAAKATEESSDLILLPWSETGSMSEVLNISRDITLDKMSSSTYRNFAAKVLEEAKTNIAIFVNKGFGGTLPPRPSTLTRNQSEPKEHVATWPATDHSHHIFVPFLGGADGRAAVRLALQLAENRGITATIVNYASGAESDLTTNVTVRTKGGQVTESSHENVGDSAFFASLQRSLPDGIDERVVFETASSPVYSAHQILSKAQSELAQDAQRQNGIVILGRRHSSSTAIVTSQHDHVTSSSCLGEVADAVLESGIRASLLVVQAKSSSATSDQA